MRRQTANLYQLGIRKRNKCNHLLTAWQKAEEQYIQECSINTTPYNSDKSFYVLLKIRYIEIQKNGKGKIFSQKCFLTRQMNGWEKG